MELEKGINYLYTIPGFGNIERSMLLDDIENGSGDGLCLLGWSFKLNWFHLWFWFPPYQPYRCCKHPSFNLFGYGVNPFAVTEPSFNPSS